MTRLVVQLTTDELAELIEGAVADALSAPQQPAPLLDRAGLARALDVSLPTVDRLRKDGMPRVRVGDVDRFDRAEVLAWLRAREQRGKLKLVGGAK